MLFFLEVPMNKLRETRVIKRVSQFQLRLLSGVHQSKISLIENNLIQPRPEEAKKLSKALGASAEELFPEQR